MFLADIFPFLAYLIERGLLIFKLHMLIVQSNKFHNDILIYHLTYFDHTSPMFPLYIPFLHLLHISNSTHLLSCLFHSNFYMCVVI